MAAFKKEGLGKEKDTKTEKEASNILNNMLGSLVTGIGKVKPRKYKKPAD